MLLLNIDHVPGRKMEALGIVKGTVDEAEAMGAGLQGICAVAFQESNHIIAVNDLYKIFILPA